MPAWAISMDRWRCNWRPPKTGWRPSAICRCRNRRGCARRRDSRLEIELDEGSAWRLGADSQGALADYTRLSTGQRVTLLWLDRGLSYFTGEPAHGDSLTVAMPGAQVVFTRGARVRFEVRANWSQIAVLEGMVRFSSPATVMDLWEGQTTRVEPAYPGRFFFDREFPHMDLDDWSEARDKALASPVAAIHVPERYGLADLDAAGEWVQTDLGAVWRPKEQADWIPYRDGRWRWYGPLGYTWVSDEPWGWLPYHYGRWTRKDKLGWVWIPSASGIFKPAEVYWMRGDKLAGWGPLAPGEEWNGSTMPAEYLNSNTTFAALDGDARIIDPEGFAARPKEPLKAAAFALALPSPSFPAERLEATRPLVVSPRTHVAPEVSGATFEGDTVVANNIPPPPPVVIVTPPAPSPAPPAPPPDDQPPVVVNPLSVILLTPPSANASAASAQPAPTVAGGSNPRPERPARGEPPKSSSPSRRFHEGEAAYFRAVQKSLDANDFSGALSALDAWTARHPHSDFEPDRQFHYVRAYDAVQQPARVLEIAGSLMARGIDQALPDPRQALTVLYLASLDLQKIQRPTRVQVSTGQSAASELLSRLPRFFVPGSRPATTTEAEWAKMRGDLEAVANGALKVGPRRAASRR